jgi:hypothetical protein
MSYNFARIHQILSFSPAMEAGIANVIPSQVDTAWQPLFLLPHLRHGANQIRY